ncbi:MAG: type VI secretion system baseplate subunit TssG [Massilia sp.]
MQTTKRRFEPGVIARIFAEPHRFEYFQAVRMLELWLKRNGAPHESAVANFLRFHNSLSLGFPASQIESLTVEPRQESGDIGALGDAIARGELRYIRLTPAFMGLLGMSGSLPSHYTERIAAHVVAERDEGPRAFLDTFSNRALALFYEAWRKYRLELKYELGGNDAFLPLLLSLAGVGHKSLQQRLHNGDDGLLDESLGYYCGVLLRRPISAGAIARVMSEYFGVRVAVEQFVGNWYALPAAQQTILGDANAVLGASAVVGERAWQRDLRMRLTVGPLARASFVAFLPGGKASTVLAKLLTMFTGLTLEYEIELVLLASEVRGIRLDSTREGGRLGWDSFLLAGEAEADRRDVRYDIGAATTPRS